MQTDDGFSDTTSLPPYYVESRATSEYYGELTDEDPNLAETVKTKNVLVRLVLISLDLPLGSSAQGQFKLSYKGFDHHQGETTLEQVRSSKIVFHTAINTVVTKGWDTTLSDLVLSVLDSSGRMMGGGCIPVPTQYGETNRKITVNSLGWSINYKISKEPVEIDVSRSVKPLSNTDTFEVPPLRNSMFTSTMASTKGGGVAAASVVVDNWFYGNKAANGMPIGCRPPPDPATELLLSFSSASVLGFSVPCFLVKSVVIVKPSDTPSTYILIAARTGHSLLITTQDPPSSLRRFASFASSHLQNSVHTFIEGGKPADDAFTLLVKTASDCTYHPVDLEGD